MSLVDVLYIGDKVSTVRTYKIRSASNDSTDRGMRMLYSSASVRALTPGQDLHSPTRIGTTSARPEIPHVDWLFHVTTDTLNMNRLPRICRNDIWTCSDVTWRQWRWYTRQYSDSRTGRLLRCLQTNQSLVSWPDSIVRYIWSNRKALLIVCANSKTQNTTLSNFCLTMAIALLPDYHFLLQIWIQDRHLHPLPLL